MTTVTIVSEGCVTRASAEPGAEDLWLAPPVLRASTGWALEPAGLCRGPVCGRRTEFVRGDGAVNLAALARQRGQAAVRDDEGRVWVFGASAEARAANRPSLDAPDFTLPDLDGRPHSLADAHGRKVVLIAWASW